MQQRSEVTGMKVLDSAIKLFSTRGLNAVSVDDICEEVGVSKGAFHHHFESKQAFFLACWMAGCKRLTMPSKHQRTKQHLKHSCKYAEPSFIFLKPRRKSLMFLEFRMQASGDKTIWEANIAPYRRYHEYFTSLIKKGVEEGSFVDVDATLASRMIVSTAMKLLLQSLFVNNLLK